jgi:hypothetical protein
MTGVLVNAWAFDYSKEINKAQNRFGKVKDYPIVIFNQDDISWQLAQSNAFGDQPAAKEKRIQIIQKYVENKSGMEITQKEAESLEIYVTDLKDSAFAMPILQGDWGDRTFKMCAVFPASPNTNQRLENERMLGLLTEEVYADLNYEDINLRMSYEELGMFSLYHEISHCLDPKFLPGNYNGEESPYNVHLSESYAEALALLILEQMGYQNMGKTRGHMRMVYSRKMGEYFAQNSRLSMGNPFLTKGGVIYHLDPALRGAKEFAFYSGNSFEGMSLEMLVQEAVSIVNEYALDSRTFFAIASYLASDNKEESIQVYRERAYESPELFYKAYAGLIEYDDYTSYVLRQIFDKSATTERDSRSSVKNTFLDIEPRLCELFKKKKKNSFNAILDLERRNLRESFLPAKSQREIAKELNSIHEDLLRQCP